MGKAKAIMVQGTMSNAGKSLIAAGLCRIFHQDGLRAAPFKSQNMALNSFITDEGLEMGRAQVMQAEAAGISPEAAMNPILLKPTNDTGSQVIVNGKVLGNMSAREYFAYKQQLIPDILKAYNDLAERFDVIVIEGAGSPAEINLKDNDIVNMGMAKMAHAPVLLVGDIDRGGVFAQLVGTMELLEPSERQMVKGMIINKFRGDRSILDSGVEMIENMLGVPVVGVTPYIHIEVDDEDSLTERFDHRNGSQVPLIDIAVIRLPRISNFTDFNTFETIDGVSLRYADSPAKLGNPDLILLPGTKNTMGDLRWLRESGMEASILKLVNSGTPLFGVCGGYQMLGKSLSDPDGVEEGGTMAGMGLLPLKTVFADGKTRTRAEGHFLEPGGIFSSLAGVPIEGYEIHMGVTALDSEETDAAAEPCSSGVLSIGAGVSGAAGTGSAGNRDRAGGQTVRLTSLKAHSGAAETEKLDGYSRGNVYGSYVHGIFDREEVTKAIVTALGRKKGIDMSKAATVDFTAFKETQYDILAKSLRDNMDIRKIYDILEHGI